VTGFATAVIAGLGPRVPEPCHACAPPLRFVWTDAGRALAHPSAAMLAASRHSVENNVGMLR
jgi:hypothetical protein